MLRTDDENLSFGPDSLATEQRSWKKDEWMEWPWTIPPEKSAAVYSPLTSEGYHRFWSAKNTRFVSNYRSKIRWKKWREQPGSDAVSHTRCPANSPRDLDLAKKRDLAGTRVNKNLEKFRKQFLLPTSTLQATTIDDVGWRSDPRR